MTFEGFTPGASRQCMLAATVRECLAPNCGAYCGENPLTRKGHYSSGETVEIGVRVDAADANLPWD